jgi:2-amino-4-hydroxy-6-hydroxymethyldihydropteridine diphosphokinase
MTVTSYIGLGSNLDQPIAQVQQGIQAIAHLPHTQLKQCSSLYETAPHGPVVQDNFINAVISIETDLTARDLLQHLQQIEEHHHRERNLRWGPRTLDCDILLYGNETHATEHLKLPHPCFMERLFVLIPLLEIAPKLRLPNGKKIAEQILLLQADETKEKVTRLSECGAVS